MRRGLERQSWGIISAMWKGQLLFQLLFLILLLFVFSVAKGRNLWTQIEMLTLPGWFQCWGCYIHSDSPLLVKCLLLPLPVNFNSVHTMSTTEEPGPIWAKRWSRWEAALVSPLLSKQFSSGPTLAYATQWHKRSVTNWAYILDGGLRSVDYGIEVNHCELNFDWGQLKSLGCILISFLLICMPLDEFF